MGPSSADGAERSKTVRIDVIAHDDDLSLDVIEPVLVRDTVKDDDELISDILPPFLAAAARANGWLYSDQTTRAMLPGPLDSLYRFFALVDSHMRQGSGIGSHSLLFAGVRACFHTVACMCA